MKVRLREKKTGKKTGKETEKETEEGNEDGKGEKGGRRGEGEGKEGEGEGRKGKEREGERERRGVNTEPEGRGPRKEVGTRTWKSGGVEKVEGPKGGSPKFVLSSLSRHIFFFFIISSLSWGSSRRIVGSRLSLLSPIRWTALLPLPIPSVDHAPLPSWPRWASSSSSLNCSPPRPLPVMPAFGQTAFGPFG